MTDPHDEMATIADHRVEPRKEAFTMALYVGICLLAALFALPETGGRTPPCRRDHLGRLGGTRPRTLVRLPGLSPTHRCRSRPQS